ncbi:RNA polymerase sigma factor [Aeoliella sp. ICT_H6.2]|uniref:RNA polymerase sigma factor n=1 Tax=Aeoliella straminimaris TaxID=2954799 RepID=A0A9X2FCG2_9BACT|nr:RNA polymerase sigma factor [Aeoliella straminimaris]MCO6045648.1 RNA polymerase sigma factor [Aeoliella straminimaris]
MPRHFGSMTAVSVPLPPPAASDRMALLVTRHQATVWRYVRYLGATTAEADDLVQETFLAVFRSDFVHESDRQTASYLRTTARRRLLMLRRKESRRPVEVELESAETVWAETMGDGPADPYLEALDGCLQHLEGRARTAIDLQYTDRLSREEIASRLDLKPEGVKTLLRRTRDALRECIERKLTSQ